MDNSYSAGSLFSVSEIDGNLFEHMLNNGFLCLVEKEKEVNDMNVFPVPDGDTGTNLKLTLSGGIEHAESDAHLGRYLTSVSEGMLFGARGNSGVIVSQIFKGISSVLSSLDKMNVPDFIQALICGYKTAYASLPNPVEGTVLTVAREGTEAFTKHLQNITGFGEMFSVYLDGMYRSLERTPELLPKLKEAQVTDSGAYGFILIMEGMAKYLCGEQIKTEVSQVKKSSSVDFSLFDSDSNFDYGYCMEFLLRLMKSKTGDSPFVYEDFVSELEKRGESLVCVQDGSIVKVHIHVFKPSPVIDLAQKYGEFLTFKLENMSLQHSEKLGENTEVFKKNKEHCPLAVIAPVNGKGMAQLIGSFSCVYVIDSGVNYNTSTNEFVTACKMVDADKIVIMPNNKNVIASANQAVSLLDKNIEVVPTKNSVQCYYSLAMDDTTSDADSRVSAFRENAESVRTILFARATRTVTVSGVFCSEGMYVSYSDGKPLCCKETLVDALVESLKMFGDFSVCLCFTGKDFVDSDGFFKTVQTAFPDVEFSVNKGDQDVYDLMIGLV